METAAGILALLAIACIVLCGHYLQQIRDELREMNGKRGGGAAGRTGGGYARR